MLVCLLKKRRPIRNRASQVPRVDEVERFIEVKSPVGRCIVNLEMQVWGDPTGLYRGKIRANHLGAGEFICKIDCPYPCSCTYCNPRA